MSTSATPLASPLDRFRLDDQVTIVTGASSGLGAHFAKVLQAVGAQVVLTARRSDRLRALAADLPGAFVLVADMADDADRERLVADVVDRFGRVDVLVNNAGVGGTVAVENEELDRFRTSMEVNVTALWHLSKLCAPSMIASGAGSIVNVASMLGHVGSTPVKQGALLREQRCRDQPHARAGTAMGTQGRSRQRVVSRVVPVGDD